MEQSLVNQDTKLEASEENHRMKLRITKGRKILTKG